MPSAGFAAVLPQFDPPWLPGMWITSSNPIGVKGPSLRALRMRCRNCSRSSGVRMYGLRSSAVNFCRENGGGAVGMAASGTVSSPGTVVFCGTGRSSIGQIGVPVTRSNTYRYPVLLAIATTSIARPFWRMVVSCGAELLSRSQMS